MKMKRILSLLPVLLPLLSCHPEEAAKTPEKDIAFVAIRAFETRCQIGTNALPSWCEGDRIAITGEDADNPAEFVLRSGAGCSVASFEGEKPEGDEFIVCYPSDARCDGDSYRGTLSTLVRHAVPDHPLGILPMWGHARDLSSVSLSCLCGILRLDLKGSASLKNVTLDAGRPVSGDFMYNIPAGIFAMIGGANIISMDASGTELIATKAIPFCFILPPGEYDELTFTITAADGDVTYYSVPETVVIEPGVCRPLSFDLNAI